MTQTDSTKRFSDRVQDYARYRPSYPEPMFDFLAARFGLSVGSVVADVGSGTGISTEPLLRRGYRVLAVEPNEAMRNFAESRLRGHNNFMSLGGTAEETGIASHQVDLVLAAQAFHWFEPRVARAEFLRILKPGGAVALVWNERVETGSRFLQEYEQLLRRFGTDYLKVKHQNVKQQSTLTHFFGGKTVQQQIFHHEQVLDWEGLRGRVLSSSYVPAAGMPGYEPMLAALAELFARESSEVGSPQKVVRMPYDCALYFSDHF